MRVVDAKENTTTTVYDTLGQMVSLDNPDTGRTEHRYDLSGNLAAKETANLRAAGQLIRYQYRFNRLEGIDYPDSPDVAYVYGDPGAAFNRAGRVVTADRRVGHRGALLRQAGRDGEGEQRTSPPTPATGGWKRRPSTSSTRSIGCWP